MVAREVSSSRIVHTHLETFSGFRIEVTLVKMNRMQNSRPVCCRAASHGGDGPPVVREGHWSPIQLLAILGVGLL